MPATTPFFYFTRPYGFDPAIGNSMHFVFLPVEVKILAAAAALATFIIVRKKILSGTTPAASTPTAITFALVIASLIISLRADMNMADFLMTVEHKYSSRHGDDKLSLIDDNMAIYVKAKQYIDANYAVLTPSDDLLIPKLNAQYILAPLLPHDAQIATYIIVTDPLSNYDEPTHTITTGSHTIANIEKIFGHGYGAKGLYKKTTPQKENSTVPAGRT